MTDEAGPATAQAPPHRGPSRRAFLVGGGIAVLAGAGAGAGLASAKSEPRHPAARPPADLVAALAAERVLIASVDTARSASGVPRAVLAQLRADHVAHERALQAALADVAGPGAASPPPSSARSAHPVAPPPPATPSAAQLKGAERAASRRAAARAGRLTGRDATLLASIAACEASHAELLG